MSITSDAGAPATTEPKLHRPEAIEIAKAFIGLLEGTYDRLVVAGSLRRRLAYVGDIEIVAVPRTELVNEGLFEDMPTEIDQVHARVEALRENDILAPRLDKNGSPRWGRTLKLIRYQGAKVDLFTPSSDRFGWILAIRTGPAAFSRQLVKPQGTWTKDGRPGLLPRFLKPESGYLTRGIAREKLATPEERDVFELFGIRYLEPWERT